MKVFVLYTTMAGPEPMVCGVYTSLFRAMHAVEGGHPGQWAHQNFDPSEGLPAVWAFKGNVPDSGYWISEHDVEEGEWRLSAP